MRALTVTFSAKIFFPCKSVNEWKNLKQKKNPDQWRKQKCQWFIFSAVITYIIIHKHNDRDKLLYL
jgi:hypothetical protein